MVRENFKVRDSNMELLRCVAMLLVIVAHTDFLSLGVPQYTEIVACPFSVFFRFFVQALSVVCVDVFILLSGWYGIKPTTNRFCEFLFQVFFFSLLIYIVLVLIEPNNYLNLKSVSKVLMLNSGDYWFVKSYILLYLFSPILNVFVECCNSSKQFLLFLFPFFIFQTIYGWLSINGANELGGGYSAISFMGLYLLARYMRLYPHRYTMLNAYQYFIIFFSIVLFLTVISYGITLMDIPVVGRIFTYTNPLVIFESMTLVYAFSKIKIKSDVINWIAISCFAVYLIHANEFILRAYYGCWIKYLFDNENGLMFILYVSMTIIFVFFISILIDKIRIIIWNIVCRI